MSAAVCRKRDEISFLQNALSINHNRIYYWRTLRRRRSQALNFNTGPGFSDALFPNLSCMAAANLACLSSFGTFFLFPLFITAHGGDQVDIGIIMGAFALSSVLCRPWISDMIDRIGRKKSYAAGSLIMTVMPAAYLLFRGASR